MDPSFLRADELGIRLEIVAGLPIWEPAPVPKHQKAIDRIRASIAQPPSDIQTTGEGCSCMHLADI